MQTKGETSLVSVIIYFNKLAPNKPTSISDGLSKISDKNPYACTYCKKPRWQSTLAHYIKVAKVSLILSAVESVAPQLEECKYKAWHDDLRHTLLLYLSSVWPFSGLWPTNELEAHGSGRPNFWGLCGSKHLVCHLGRVLMSSHDTQKCQEVYRIALCIQILKRQSLSHWWPRVGNTY